MKSFFTVLLLLSTSMALAQQVIEGKVTSSEDNAPLPGVSILIKGTSTGTTTNFNGEFSISASQGDILQLSFIGYKAIERQVNNETRLDVALDADLEQLEEVVVVGYGAQKKVNVTGAVESIDGESITRQPIFQASQALVGLAPGLTAIQSSGQPGGDNATLRIRGIGSLGASNNPLVLIDGIAGDLNGIDPSDIESISVLKDAAAASIYGSRASNGVILVTTKRGKSGKLSVNYNTYMGFQSITDRPKYLGALDYLRVSGEDQSFIDDYAANVGRDPDLYPDTDWMEELFTENGFQQYHSLSATGGNENVKLLASISYTDQGANVKNYNFTRYNGRFNTDIKLSEKLNVNFDLNFRQERTESPNAPLSLVFQQAFRIDPTRVAVHSDGSWGDGWQGRNPIAEVNAGGRNQNEDNYFRGLLKLNYEPIEGLNLTFMYSPEYQDVYIKNFNAIFQTVVDWTTNTTRDVPNRNELVQRNSRYFQDNVNALISYTKDIGNHNFTVLGGYEMIKNNFNSIRASRNDFIIQDYQELDAGSQETALNAGNATHSGLVSYFGRANYSFNEKYLFEANIRRDASSRFASENRVGIFPSFSVGWRVSEENFFEGISGFMSNLKLRASWGQLGNQQIGSDFPYTSNIAIGSSNFIFDGSLVTGATQNVLANPNIQWETTETANIGIDAGFFDDRLTLAADYYIRETKDILLALPIPAVVGLSPSTQNAGSVENRGWDLSLGWRENKGEFSYGINFNASDVINEITDLSGVGPIISGNSINQLGNPIGSIFGFEMEGLFQSEGEINDAPTQFGSVIPGNIRYKDQLTVDTNGDGIPDQADGVINGDDRVIIGNPFPRLTYALNLNAAYKGFDLNMTFQGVGKRDVLLQGDAIWPLWNAGKVQEWHVEEAWTPENPNAEFPVIAATSSGSNDARASSTWVLDASYLSLRNVTLGYTLPKSVIDRLQLSDVRVFLSGQNLLNFNSLPEGLNPLIPNNSRGAIYPIVASYTLGANIRF